MSNAEHPLTGYFDVIAMGGRATDAEVEALIVRCIDSQSEMTAEQLRRELTRWTRKITEAAKDGNALQARTWGREAVAVLSTSLGDLPPAPGRDDGKSMREVVDLIKRSET